MYSSPPLSPPPAPSPFVWTCHACNLTLPLAVTTRCLSCSHSFCAGRPSTSVLPPKPTNKKARRVQSTKACGSTFDYQGWQARGEWRRQRRSPDNLSSESSEEEEEEEEEEDDGKMDMKKRNCERDCDFPSQCRWAPRLAAAAAAKAKSGTTSAAVTSNTQLRRHLVARQLERAERRAIQETLSFAGAETHDDDDNEDDDDEIASKQHDHEAATKTKRKTTEAKPPSDLSSSSSSSFSFPILDFAVFKAQGERWLKSLDDDGNDGGSRRGNRERGRETRTRVNVIETLEEVEEEEKVGRVGGAEMKMSMVDVRVY